jgi:hypothetical protein
MKINELQLDEIERLTPNDYRGGKSYLYGGNRAKRFEPLPGDSGFLYTIEDPRGEPTIKMWDPNSETNDKKPVKDPYEFNSEYQTRLKKWEQRQRSGKKLPQIIGKLTLEKPYNFPLKNALQVGTITVDEDYRGKGLAKALYGIVLAVMKRPLVAGSSQTPGGRQNWVSLSQIPGVEMKGYVGLDDEDINPDDGWGYKTKSSLKNIDIIMGKLGGQYMGKGRYDTHFFAFDVQPATTGKELEAHVKQNLAKVYGENYNTEVGLYATWAGQ